MSPQDTEKSLKYSIKEGFFATLATGLTAEYFTPFLLLLGGTAREVGLLGSLPNLFASVVQLKSPDIAERIGSRKRVINIFVLLQALMLVPMVGAYFAGSCRAAVFIASVTLFTACGALVAPLWGSMMTDLVNEEKRGEYFGWRSRVLGLTLVVSTFSAGWVLRGAERYYTLAGFAAIFGLALIFRLLSRHYMGKMREPLLKTGEGDYFSLSDFIGRARESNFARFVFYSATVKFSVHIASPFFAVYMLKDLRFDYLTYTVVTLAASLAAILTIKSWGIHADRAGNLSVVRLTSRLVAFIPLLWLLGSGPLYLFLVQCFSGFAWAGFNLASTNFIYDASTPGKRARCIAYFNLFNGVSVALGALAGGLLAIYLPETALGGSLVTLIAVSAFMRLLSAFLMPFRLKEVRAVEPVESYDLFLSILRLKPLKAEK